MRENGLDNSPARRIPVYRNKLNIGHISYHELMVFLNHEEEGRNIYTQKLLFDLGSALVIIREIRSKAGTQTGRIIKMFAFVAMIVIALLVFNWTYRNGMASYVAGVDGGVSKGQYADRTVKTPKGKRYHIRLPDGSQVWLNSASKISYPARFTGGRRVVFLTGEAYFEVAKVYARSSGPIQPSLSRAASFPKEGMNIGVPFVVKTNKQEIEVLGTRFNVNAYGDEEYVKTMLLEGSVKITPVGGESESVVLKPNQLGTLTDTHIDVAGADPEIAIAWKGGEYWFRREPLENIMRVLARWHDVEVVYEDDTAGKQIFGGSISKSWNLVQVLSTLELTGTVRFEVKGKRVIVSNYVID